MKLRLGFVSNSSSSSFVIPLDKISALQLHQLQNHLEEAKKLGMDMEWIDEGGEWDIKIKDSIIYGDTMMDNFGIDEFLKKIGVPDDVIKWYG